mgnify:CR=1 FL=1
MPINKDIIIRLISSFIFIAITARVLVPVIFSFFKSKISGQHSQDTDIDNMIRRQKERLRAEFPLPIDNTPSSSVTKEAQAIYQEIDWGAIGLSKEIKQEISNKYSYSIADSKINAFLVLCKKKHYLQFLSNQNVSSNLNLKNYLVTLLLLKIMIEEIREKKFYILEKVSLKLGILPSEFALALQIKILLDASLKNEMKEDRIFSDTLVISQYSEETINSACESIAKKEANLWAKDPSLFFEELTLALNYSSLIMPIPRLKNRKDIDTAYEIFGLSKDQKLDEIKRKYKKIALLKHPDKIVAQKLPKILERKAIDRFNQIQEAYEVIVAHKKE